MKVDSRHLPFFIQDELFLLKEEKTVQDPKIEKPEEKVPLPGVLVVVDSAESAQNARNKDSFLDRVLAAIDVRLDEIQIQSREEYIPGSLPEFRWVLFFGVPELLESQATPYQVMNDPCLHMAVDSLQEIESQREKKAKLWDGLQKMFGKKG